MSRPLVDERRYRSATKEALSFTAESKEIELTHVKPCGHGLVFPWLM